MASEWGKTTLRQVSKEIYRYPSFYGMEKYNRGVPVVRGEHLLENGQISTDWSDYWFVEDKYADRFPKTRLELDDLVMSVRGSIGTFSRVGPDHVGAQISPNLIRISPDPNQIEPRFLYYALRGSTAGQFIIATSSSSAVPAIRASDIKIAEVPLPPRPEQRAIAHILGTLDEKIELNRRMNETLEAMARALFKSWFVDFDPVRAKAKGHDPGLPKPLVDLFPDSFKESELGEIPAGWKVVTVADVAEINARTLGRTDSLDVIDYIEISEVMRGEVTNIVRYDRGTEPSRARRRLRHGDTVLSTVRPDRGAHFLCLNPPETLIASTGFSILSARDGNWAFLYSAMTRREIGGDLGRLADGGAYPAVGPEVIGGLSLIVPSDPTLLLAFQTLAGHLYEQSANHRIESRTLAMIRDALLPRLISGELRIPNAERAIGRCV